MATVLSLFLLKALIDLTNGRKEPEFGVKSGVDFVKKRQKNTPWCKP